jgi:hypothetical protein
MTDWRKLVEERLSAPNLPPGAKGEVIAELAAHLEEVCEQELGDRSNEKEAMRLALEQVDDWQVLGAEIVRVKSEEDAMNHRTKVLWLPGMATLLGASALLAVIQFAGFQPRLVWFGRHAMLFYWHWLVALPFFGALGAYLSQRARGSIWARLAAGLSPVLVMLITMCLILPWAVAMDGLSALLITSFGVGLTNWVAFPALALLIGELPFLHDSRVAGIRRSTT